jgi:hypothetical protein
VVDFFTRNNIKPLPAKDEQRKAIENQLSLRSKIDPQ